MTDPREAAIAWIARAMSEELKIELEIAAVSAESLDAIAVAYDVPTEECIRWLRDGGNGTGLAWRAHCEDYVKLRRELGLKGSV